LEAAAIGIPDPVVSCGSTAGPVAAGGAPRGEFFAVPIPRLDPSLGAGLVGAGAYIFRLDRNDTETPPSTLGAGAFWMDSHSWGGGLGGKLYLNGDRVRLLAGVAYADLRYDLIVAPESTGREVAIPLSQEVYGGLVHAQFRVAQGLYVGARALVGKVGTALRGEDVPEVPLSLEGEVDRVFQLNSLGPSFAFDTRDSSYYPRHGIAFDVNVDIYFGAIGSAVSYDHYEANYRHYKAARVSDVLALQAYLCAAGGDAPFFLQCQVGPKSLLRGYSFGRYRGDAMAAAQAEYRWQMRPRWVLAVFGGLTQVGSSFGSFGLDDNLYAGGVGLRFVVEPKNGVTLRVDYGWGEGESALYIGVGEAF